VSTTDITERRRSMRFGLPFPAEVGGVTEAGEPFRVNTVLDNMSVGGVYLRLSETARLGSQLLVTARFSVVANRGVVVRFKGKVLRVDPKPDGSFGVAMAAEEKEIL
jgi:hypothetical protein